MVGGAGGLAERYGGLVRRLRAVSKGRFVDVSECGSWRVETEGRVGDRNRFGCQYAVVIELRTSTVRCRELCEVKQCVVDRNVSLYYTILHIEPCCAMSELTVAQSQTVRDRIHGSDAEY